VAADFLSIIERRRNGQPHTREDLVAVAEAAARHTAPDYQLAAWLMAAFLNPLSRPETALLTQAMADSGDRVDLTGLPKPWIDKHSTGGVGDKITILALPILAACGVTVVKMSGRGLGHTGGTIDKLASVPGFRLDLSPEEMKAQAQRIGIALTGQSPDLAPADKALYALRDVTATVPSLPLIVSSILSKKIAGGADTVVLDVKCGRGAFMDTRERGEELLEWLVDVGTQCGLSVRAALTDMDQPLGSAVGNALEVEEARRILRGDAGGPLDRVIEVATTLVGLALEASGRSDGIAQAKAVLTDGSALAKAREWFAAQGADFDAHLPSAPVTTEVVAPESGWIARIDALAVGKYVVDLGGGRRRKEDDIDPRVGVEVLVSVGDEVSVGQPIARVHVAEPTDTGRLATAFEVVSGPIAPVPPILSVR